MLSVQQPRMYLTYKVPYTNFWCMVSQASRFFYLSLQYLTHNARSVCFSLMFTGTKLGALAHPPRAPLSVSNHINNSKTAWSLSGVYVRVGMAANIVGVNGLDVPKLSKWSEALFSAAPQHSVTQDEWRPGFSLSRYPGWYRGGKEDGAWNIFWVVYTLYFAAITDLHTKAFPPEMDEL